MKISTLLRTVPIAFAIVSSVVFLIMFAATSNERSSAALEKEYIQLGYDMQTASYDLSYLAQSYVNTLEPNFYEEYIYELNTKKAREKIITRLKELNPSHTELSLIENSKMLSDKLAVLELEAFNYILSGDIDAARAAMYGNEYRSLKNSITSGISGFQDAIRARCGAEARAAKTIAQISFFACILTISCILCLVIWYAKRLESRIRIINQLGDIARSISEGDFDVKIANYVTKDEFGTLAESLMAMIDTATNIINEINAMIFSATTGDFTKRADPSAYRGEFSELLMKLNELLETIIAEHKKSAEFEAFLRTSELKNRFLVNMSHEIRTPMNSVIGLSQLALLREQNQKNYDTFKKINISSKNLLTIVNDILDYSKIEADKMSLVEDIFCLEDIIANAFMIASEKLEQRPVEMLVNISHDVPYFLFGDKTRLWQVLKNLLDNSVKFTMQGNIILYVTVIDEPPFKKDPEKIYLHFKVEDTGLGMSPAQLEKLFQPFEQFHSTGRMQFTGTGLGMAISKSLMSLMGGTVEVSSQEGVGTTTELFIGFKQNDAASTMETVISRYQMKNKSVLIADDSQNALDIMSDLLHMLGVFPVCVTNGAEAVKIARERFEANNPFDIVLIDYVMPEMDGFETLRRLQKYTNGKTKLLMVPAYADSIADGDISKYGFSETIEKPFVPSAFVQKLCDTIHEYSVEDTHEYSKFHNAKVLVCEDNKFNQDVIQEILDLFGITPTIANNGLECVDYLKKSEYHIVFMDLLMPVMDGYEATSAIRSSGAAYAGIPIISMTANVMQDEIEKCLASGMNAHVGKPIDITDVHDLLLKYLPAYTHNGELGNSDKTDWDSDLHIPGVDVASGIARYGGKKEKYFLSLHKFIKDAPNELMSYSEFTSEENYENSLKYLHTMKGVFGNLSLKTLYTLTVSMELAMKNYELMDGIYVEWVSAFNDTKDSILRTLPVVAEKPTAGGVPGSKDELKEILTNLSEHLEAYAATLAEEQLLALKSKEWSIQPSILENLSSVIDNYEYELALDIINELIKTEF